MNPLGTRARAEELARLLEGAVAGPTSSTAGFAQLATRLRTVAPALEQARGLRPEFRASLRQRLLAVAEVHDVSAEAAPTGPAERARTWSRSWSAQRRLAAVSGAMATVVALTGVGVASSRSLPGQPFYGLKRAAEGLQLDLAGNDTDRGTKHLEFAATRLREVRALVDGGTELAVGSSGLLAGGRALGGTLESRITDTLHAFSGETTKGRDLLEGVYRSTGRTAPLRVLTTFAQEQTTRLDSLLAVLPTGTTGAARQALTLVTEVGTTASQLLSMGSCGASCAPQAAGPTLPAEPVPTPGAGATPSGQPDNNGVPPCGCAQPSPTPDPTTEPSSSPTQEPTSRPTSHPTATPSPTSSPAPGPLPSLPIPLPTILPTLLPTGTPLPAPLPRVLPTLLRAVAIKP